MARMGPAAKLRRVLEFLIGLRDDRVLSVLTDCGFGPGDRARGWELLSALGSTQAVPTTTTITNAPLQALDAWRQQWARIARASLEPDFPRVYDQIFAGIDKPRQPSFAVVPILVERIEKLRRANDAASLAALAKLRKRGLTSERLAQGRQLFADVQSTKSRRLPDYDARRTKIHAAETALWNYFVEWGQIARATIKEPRLLELLGYRGGAADDEPQAPLVAVERPAPAVTPARKAKRAARSKKRPRK